MRGNTSLLTVAAAGPTHMGEVTANTALSQYAVVRSSVVSKASAVGADGTTEARLT